MTSVAICGGGLAGWMAALSLRAAIADDISITVVEADAAPVTDHLYGHLLPPEVYAFHLGLGITEPDLVMGTGSSFALGSVMMDWGKPERSWVQAFHQPLAVWDGVPMASHIAHRDGVSLQDMLVGVQATRRGVFAHPPEDAANPLSRAEYGYAFDPGEVSALYKRLAVQRGVRCVQGKVASLLRDGETALTLRLSSGESIEADLFVDAGELPQDTPERWQSSPRELHAHVATDRNAAVGPPARIIRANATGWASEVRLQTGAVRLSVGTEAIDGSLPLALGWTDTPWRGNVVSIGRSAARLEPHTCAPLKLLMRDIARLLDLFPVAADMRIEARAYNEASRDDRDHAHIFNAAHVHLPELPDTAYWREASTEPAPKLVRKLEQYDSRGILVSYDHEPFDDVDWAVLHDGLGRRPKRHDLLASLVPAEALDARIVELQSGIDAVTAKMPPHPVYLSKFLSYLQRKHA